MRVHTFPRCCGAGVLIIEHLTGKGKEADREYIKSWLYYSKRNGYRMYDFPQEYGGVVGNPDSSLSVIGGKGDQPTYVPRNGWGVLTAITTPHMKEAAELLKEFGFKDVITAHNPVMGHKITLWVVDLNTITEKELLPKETKVAKVTSK